MQLTLINKKFILPLIKLTMKSLMKNYILAASIFFSSLSSVSAEEWITDAEQITEEFLTETSSSAHYTEHVARI